MTRRSNVAAPVTTSRLLTDWDDLVDATEVIFGVWGTGAASLASPSLLKTYAHYGNPIIGAFDGETLCGVSVAFLASDPRVHLHSHITGVTPSHQQLGIGYQLKMAQRDWCVANGIDLITWTFDPMLARNAYFNLHKLGAHARRFLPNFYGSMDDDINRGDETDRLEAWWPVTESPRPVARVAQTVAVPDDYLALRARDAATAEKERAEVREQMEAAFAHGLVATDFSRTDGYQFSGSAK